MVGDFVVKGNSSNQPLPAILAQPPRLLSVDFAAVCLVYSAILSLHHYSIAYGQTIEKWIIMSDSEYISTTD